MTNIRYALGGCQYPKYRLQYWHWIVRLLNTVNSGLVTRNHHNHQHQRWGGGWGGLDRVPVQIQVGWGTWLGWMSNLDLIQDNLAASLLCGQSFSIGGKDEHKLLLKMTGWGEGCQKRIESKTLLCLFAQPFHSLGVQENYNIIIANTSSYYY